MTDANRADLVVDLELRLAYEPETGRLWRVDASGRIGRELALWRYDPDKGRCVVGNIRLPDGRTRRANRVIYRLMAGS
jgi:hypothetical protein